MYVYGMKLIQIKAMRQIDNPENRKALLKASYDEALSHCKKYVYYKGDKRKLFYRSLENAVSNLWRDRMNAMSKKLNLKTYEEYFFPE